MNPNGSQLDLTVCLPTAGGGGGGAVEFEITVLCDDGAGGQAFYQIADLTGGLPPTITIVALDGVTPYVPVGPVVACAGSTGALTQVVELLCDDNGAFQRVKTVDALGTIVATTDFDLAGAAYVTSGLVHACAERGTQGFMLCDGSTQFIRWYETGATGAIAATFDTEIDGFTAYVPAGVVQACTPDERVENQWQVLCDDNGPYLTRIQRLITGVITFDDRDLSGAGYVTVGTVHACGQYDIESVCFQDGSGDTFLRNYVIDTEGPNTTIGAFDTDFAGAPFVAAGTLVRCDSLQEQHQILCDFGNANAAFLRVYEWNPEDTPGGARTVEDFELDGITAYAPVGPVGDCSTIVDCGECFTVDGGDAATISPIPDPAQSTVQLDNLGGGPDWRLVIEDLTAAGVTLDPCGFAVPDLASNGALVLTVTWLGVSFPITIPWWTVTSAIYNGLNFGWTFEFETDAAAVAAADLANPNYLCGTHQASADLLNQQLTDLGNAGVPGGTASLPGEFTLAAARCHLLPDEPPQPAMLVSVCGTVDAVVETGVNQFVLEDANGLFIRTITVDGGAVTGVDDFDLDGSVYVPSGTVAAPATIRCDCPRVESAILPPATQDPSVPTVPMDATITSPGANLFDLVLTDTAAPGNQQFLIDVDACLQQPNSFVSLKMLGLGNNHWHDIVIPTNWVTGTTLVAGSLTININISFTFPTGCFVDVGYAGDQLGLMLADHPGGVPFNVLQFASCWDLNPREVLLTKPAATYQVATRQRLMQGVDSYDILFTTRSVTVLIVDGGGAGVETQIFDSSGSSVSYGNAGLIPLPISLTWEVDSAEDESLGFLRIVQRDPAAVALVLETRRV